MSRIRLMGAQTDLSAVLRYLLDFGRVHLDDTPPRIGLGPAERTSTEDRERRHLRRILDDVDAAIDVLRWGGA